MACARNGKSHYGEMEVIAKGRSQQALEQPNHNDCLFWMCSGEHEAAAIRGVRIISVALVATSSGPAGFKQTIR